MDRVNPAALRARLRAGPPLVGTVLSLPGAALAELVAEPFDLVWIDLEHGALGPADLQDAVIGVQAARTAALARVPLGSDDLPRALDCGVDGVVVPAVGSVAEAHELVRRLRYPPAGIRGYGLRRAGTRDRGHDGRAPAPPVCLVQIEDAAGVAAAAQIAELEGVDALVVGTSDLSFALGTPLDVGSEPMRAAIAEVRRAAVEHGVAFGLAGGFEPGALGEPEEGAALVVLSTDARLCAAAVDAAAGSWRARLNAERRTSR